MKYLITVTCLFVLALVEGQTPSRVPPFLVGAPESAVKEFFELIKKDEDKTDPEIEADIDAFVAKLGGDYPNKFKAFKEELKAHEAEYEKAHAAAVAKFSPAAKEADAKLTAIAEDTKLNGIQKRQKIKEAMESLPKAVRDELEKAIAGGA
uniref:Ag2 n=2 Tax=Ascarididae TaxID=6250 RepID=I6LJI7_ASCLU|nr:Ag2 [Baylisascaris schroederi]ACJ03763.1 Ag2 [Ascaris lumbricoides]